MSDPTVYSRMNARVVRGPRGRLTHLDYRGQAAEYRPGATLSTSCGRVVPDSWTAAHHTAAMAVQLVTCPSCAAWARYHHVAELAGSQVRADLFATEAANSVTRYAEMVQQLAAPVKQDAVQLEDEQRDYAEESYWRHYCAECDGPCRSADGHAELLDAPPVHGPGSAERFAADQPSSVCDTASSRGRRAVLRLETGRRSTALSAALANLPPTAGRHL